MFELMPRIAKERPMEKKLTLLLLHMACQLLSRLLQRTLPILRQLAEEM